MCLTPNGAKRYYLSLNKWEREDKASETCIKIIPRNSKSRKNKIKSLRDQSKPNRRLSRPFLYRKYCAIKPLVTRMSKGLWKLHGPHVCAPPRRRNHSHHEERAQFPVDLFITRLSTPEKPRHTSQGPGLLSWLLRYCRHTVQRSRRVRRGLGGRICHNRKTGKCAKLQTARNEHRETGAAFRPLLWPRALSHDEDRSIEDACAHKSLLGTKKTRRWISIDSRGIAARLYLESIYKSTPSQ